MMMRVRERKREGKRERGREGYNVRGTEKRITLVSQSRGGRDFSRLTSKK